MAYKALYRKYRPETFDDVVGQKHIVTTLKNAIANNKIAHAYIFSGPRGTGKTTTAKLLAKAINCLDENKPCNECENCKAINNNQFPDIIEIDAASNNGIEEVRDLIEKVKFAPLQGKYKVYIIDEVHMMTAGAFNALLKTLEEPPAHVVFILATTDVHKVIPTVLSRCQRFDFTKISYDDIVNRIKYVLDNEQITYEAKVPPLIAELADGGLRDALSMLDQVIAYAGNNIMLQHIYDVYGLMSSSDMVSFLKLLSTLKAKDALETIESFISKGIDLKRLTYDLMVCLKDSMVYDSCHDSSILERLSESQARELLQCYDSTDTLKVVDILTKATDDYKQNSNNRLFFELACLKIIDVKTTQKVESFASKYDLKEEVKPVVKPQVKQEEIKENIVNEVKEEIKPVVEEKKKLAYDKPEDSEPIEYSLEEYVNILCQGNKKYKEGLIAKWPEIKSYIKNEQTRYIAQLLADSTIGAANENYVLIVYDYKLLALSAKQKNNIILIKKFLNDIFNLDLEVYVVERATFIDSTRLFLNLNQANKLPQIHPIPHVEANEVKEVIEEENNEEDNEEDLGKELFGDNLVEE